MTVQLVGACQPVPIATGGLAGKVRIPNQVGPGAVQVSFAAA